jgi:hypothetical protein
LVPFEDIHGIRGAFVRWSTEMPPLLISRGSGVWWRELVLKSLSLQELCSVGGDDYDEFTIREEIAARDRRSMFDASVAAFQNYMATAAPPVASRAPADDLLHAIETLNDYDRPLAVQIAALLHIAGVDAAEGRAGMAGLLDRILGLEYEHWDKVLHFGQHSNFRTAVKNGVAQVTLIGGVPDRQAAEALIACTRSTAMPGMSMSRALPVPWHRYSRVRMMGWSDLSPISSANTTS